MELSSKTALWHMQHTTLFLALLRKKQSLIGDSARFSLTEASHAIKKTPKLENQEYLDILACMVMLALKSVKQIFEQRKCSAKLAEVTEKAIYIVSALQHSV